MTLKLLGDRDNIYIFPWYIAELTATKYMKNIAGSSVKEIFGHNENSFHSMYYDIESSAKIGKYLFNNIAKDKRFFNQVINNIYKYSDKLVNFSKTVEKTNVTALSEKELLSIYSKYIEKLIQLRTWGWVPVFIDGVSKNFLTDHIRSQFSDFLIKKGKIDDFNEYYSILSSSEKMSEVRTEELARLNMLIKIEKHRNSAAIVRLIKAGDWARVERSYSDINKLIDNHLRTFGWLTYAYIGPVMTKEYLYKTMKDNLDEGEIKAQKLKIQKHYRELKKKQEKIINELKIPAKLVYLFKVSAELMYIKDYRKGIYQKSYVAMDKVLNELSSRLEIGLKEIKLLTFEETKAAIYGKINYKNILNKRIKKFSYIVKNGTIKVYEGHESEQLIKSKQKLIKSDARMSVRELKGLTAYPGKVKGRVKIVLVVKDIDKVNPGDILVSSATNPDLIIAMKKAAAFVTDFGGIISHAAIVSREMKKPCVVGTGNASRVLKDGDMVEVDADKGIVKKL